MTEKEALSLLSLDEGDENSVLDAFELACFQEKQSFYKDPILPKIIDARIKKITRLSEAANFLLNSNEKNVSSKPISLHDLETSDWKLFFQWYEQNKALLRKELANINTANGMLEILLQLKDNEEVYATVLKNKVEINSINDVKISVQTPIIEIVAELNPYLEQGVIDNSFASLKNLNKIKDNFKLHLEVNRVKKLMNES